MEQLALWIAFAFVTAMNFAHLKAILDLNSRLEKLEKERDAR